MLRIERIHIDAYKALRNVHLELEDLGDVVVVAGPNGSGKSTLLEVLWSYLDGHPPPQLVRGRIDVRLGNSGRCVWLAGSEPGLDSPRLRKTGQSYGYWDDAFDAWRRSDGPPSVLMIPSEGRGMVVPAARDKRPGTWPEPARAHRWAAPSSWNTSVEALLYTARWLDLNAKEDGRPEDATRFAMYADAFRAFAGEKELAWVKGELRVRVGDVEHGLEELSSGEKQVLLLLGELYTYWSPGSLVLIDEPELHLHPVLQAQLFQALLGLREERGGQLWIATQSSQIYGLAPEGSHVHLGRL